jgi:hypothetical protein
MIGDYATKPLQGALFRKFRDQIMGVVPASDPGPGKAKPGNGKLDTQKTKPRKGKSLVPPGSTTVGRHHRSVLGGVKSAGHARGRGHDPGSKKPKD